MVDNHGYDSLMVHRHENCKRQKSPGFMPKSISLNEENTSPISSTSKYFMCHERVPEQSTDPMSQELSLSELGFSVSKYFNWDGISLTEKSNMCSIMHQRIMNNILPDCIVQIDTNVAYKCHSSLLRAYTPYFAKADASVPILLASHITSPKTFETIYEWMKAEPKDCHELIRRDNILDLYHASVHLGIDELQEQCWVAIKSDALFQEGTAFVLYAIALEKNLMEVQNLMYPRIQYFFLVLVSSSDFFDLSPYFLRCLLKSDYIAIYSEMDVLMTAIRWLHHEWPRRVGSAADIMSCVRFGHLPPDVLIDLKRSTHRQEICDVIHSDNRILKMIDDGIAYAIMRQGFQEEDEEFNRKVCLQGLKVPAKRNVIPPARLYESYDDFERELQRIRTSFMTRKNSFTSTNRKLASSQLSTLVVNSIKSYEELRESTGILTNEMSLREMGFEMSKELDWSQLAIPQKSPIYDLLKCRFNNFEQPDFFVVVEPGLKFSCHLLVLQSYSDLFCRACPHKMVQLPTEKVTPSAFEALYKWMLSDPEKAHSILRRDNVLDLYNAAQYLEIHELTLQCWEVINNEKFFHEGTAFVLFQMARLLKLEEVKSLMVPMIQRFFLTLVCSRDFLEMEVHDVIAVLSSDYIVVDNELQVFMAAVRWLQSDWEERKSVIAKLMASVRFGLISPRNLVDIQRNIDNKDFVEIFSQPEVEKLIQDGLTYSLIREKYSSDEELYARCIIEQGIAKPKMRKWSKDGPSKETCNYREFLKELEMRRRALIEEKKRKIEKMVIVAKNDEHIEKMSKMEETSINSPTTWGSGNPNNSIEVGLEMRKKIQYSAMSPRNVIHSSAKDGSNEQKPEIPEVNLYYSPCQSMKEMFNTFDKKKKPGDEFNHRKYYQNSQEPSEQTLNIVDKNDEDVDFSMNKKRSVSQSMRMMNEIKYCSLSVILNENETPVLESNVIPRKPSYGYLRSQRSEETFDKAQMSNQGDVDCGSRSLPKPNDMPSLVVVKSAHGNEGDDSLDECDNKMISSRRYMKLSTIKDNIQEDGRETILLVGGSNPYIWTGGSDNSAEKMFAYDLGSNVWRDVGKMPQPRHHHAIAQLRGRIYVVGGSNPMLRDRNGKSVTTGNTWSFDVTSKTWYQEENLHIPRKDHVLIGYKDKLYAIGGIDERHSVLSSVEVFDPLTRRWETSIDLNLPRYGHAAAVFRDSIWVAGGTTSTRQETIFVEWWNPSKSNWINGPGLRYPKTRAQMVAINKQNNPIDSVLYLIGGVSHECKGMKGAPLSLDDIDVFIDGEWKLVSTLSTPRHLHSLAVLGSKLMIVGGASLLYNTALQDVECYDWETKTKVRNVKSLPYPLASAGIVTLPSQLKNMF